MTRKFYSEASIDKFALVFKANKNILSISNGSVRGLHHAEGFQGQQQLVDVDVDGGRRLELETFPGARFRVVDLPDVDLGAVSGQGLNTFVPLLSQTINLETCYFTSEIVRELMS